MGKTLVDKVKDFGSSAGKSARSGLYGAAIAGAVGLGVAGYASEADGEIVNVPDFCFFADTSSVQSINNSGNYFNFMNPDGSQDPVTISHKFGFISYPGLGGISVDGCADNPFYNFSGFEDSISGVYSHTLGSGNTPDDIWVVEDMNDDGIGTYDTETGDWTLGVDDYIYLPEEIMVNEVSIENNGASEMPIYTGSGTLNMPSSVVLEPSSALLLGTGIAGLYGLSRRRGSKK